MNTLIVTGPPKTGKTSALIDWMSEETGNEYRVVVVESEREANVLRRRYDQFNADRFQSINQARYSNRREDGRHFVYAIDDANVILSMVMGAGIIGAIALQGDCQSMHTVKVEVQG